MTTIDLRRPIRSERRRGFQPPWYTVYVYRCENGHETTVRANSFRGSRPTIGAAVASIRPQSRSRSERRGSHGTGARSE